MYFDGLHLRCLLISVPFLTADLAVLRESPSFRLHWVLASYSCREFQDFNSWIRLLRTNRCFKRDIRSILLNLIRHLLKLCCGCYILIRTLSLSCLVLSDLRLIKQVALIGFPLLLTRLRFLWQLRFCFDLIGFWLISLRVFLGISLNYRLYFWFYLTAIHFYNFICSVTLCLVCILWLPTVQSFVGSYSFSSLD